MQKRRHMKILLLGLFFSLFFHTQSEAQTSVYHPFPDSGIVWREHAGGVDNSNRSCSPYCSGAGPCIETDNYEFFLSGDTIIGSFTYKRIFKTGSTEGSWVGPGYCQPGHYNYVISYFSNIYIGGLRQDSLQRKVFIDPAGSVEDDLLYDFNLNVNDTLPVTFNNSQSYSKNYVSVIDSVLIGNSYHQRFWINSHHTDSTITSNFVSLIEGVGSTWGLIFPIDFYSFPSDWRSSLLCVTIDSLPVYPDTATVCELVTRVKESKEENFVLLYPNPADQHLSIRILSSASKQATAIIMNTIGEMLQQSTITEPQSEISISTLPAGIYFLQLKMESGSVVRKFVKE
jgi:hypothetical protein